VTYDRNLLSSEKMKLGGRQMYGGEKNIEEFAIAENKTNKINKFKYFSRAGEKDEFQSFYRWEK